MQTTEITRLDHRRPEVAEEIRRVMFAAYSVEGGILGVTDFFPLRRSAAHIASTEADFLGITVDGSLSAVAELERAETNRVHISSVVVLPSAFRRGLATALLRHIMAEHAHEAITVSTGIRNLPAITLYASNGFHEYTRWETPDGIPMITLMRRAESSAACIPDRVAAVRARLGLEGNATTETIREIDAMIREHPDSPDLWLLRGEAIELCSEAEAEEARRSYEHALALDPSHAGAEARLRKLQKPGQRR